jgi:hypothetical protein
LLRDGPEDPARHAQHGLILAALGRKDEAIAEGKRAVEMVPESQDAFDGPRFTGLLAEIYAWTASLMKHFACSIICSRFQTVSRSQCSSSNLPGTPCAKILASKR